MPFNGSGTYVATSLPGSWNPATTSSSATPADWNTLLADLSTALSTCITKDGQTTVSADIPMATHKITALGNATAATDALNQQSALYVYGHQTVATVAFVDFINIPTTVNNLMLCFDLLVDTSGANVGIQMYDSVGSLDVGTNYVYFNYGAESASALVQATSASSVNQAAVAFNVKTSATIGVNATLNFNNIQGVKETQFTGNSTYLNNAASDRVLLTSVGARTVVGPITGIRINVSVGTLSGKATLYASV